MLRHTLGLPHGLFYVRSVGHTAHYALWATKQLYVTTLNIKVFQKLINLEWMKLVLGTSQSMKQCLHFTILFLRCTCGLCHLHSGPLHNFARYAIHTHSPIPDFQGLWTSCKYQNWVRVLRGNNGSTLDMRIQTIIILQSIIPLKECNYLAHQGFIPQCTVQMTWPGLTPSHVMVNVSRGCHVSRGCVTRDIPQMTHQNNIWPSIPASHHSLGGHTRSLGSFKCGVNISEQWKTRGLGKPSFSGKCNEKPKCNIKPFKTMFLKKKEM